MNRFDRPRQYDYSFERYMPEFKLPDFQLLAATLENQEKQQLEAESLLEKSPKYIPEGIVEERDEQGNIVQKPYGDTQANKRYQEDMKKMQKELEDAHLTGDMNVITSTRKRVLKELKEKWGPTGVATIMEERYKGWSEGEKKLKERADTDADWASVNQQFARAQFLKGIGVLDEETRDRQGVGAPNLYDYTNVELEIVDFVNKLGDFDVKVEYSPEKNGFVYTEGRKNLTPEAKQALEGFLRNPRLKQQYQVERWNMINTPGGWEQLGEGMIQHNKDLGLKTDVLQKTKALAAKDKRSKEENKELETGLRYLGILKPRYSKGRYEENINEALNVLDDIEEDLYERQKVENVPQFAQQQLQGKYRVAGLGAEDRAYTWTGERDPGYLDYQKRGAEAKVVKERWANDEQAVGAYGTDIKTAGQYAKIITPTQKSLNDLRNKSMNSLNQQLFGGLNPVDVPLKQAEINQKAKVAGEPDSYIYLNETLIETYERTKGGGVDAFKLDLQRQGIPVSNAQELFNNLGNPDGEYLKGYQFYKDQKAELNNMRAEVENAIVVNIDKAPLEEGNYKTNKDDNTLEKVEYKQWFGPAAGYKSEFDKGIVYTYNNESWIASPQYVKELFDQDYNSLSPEKQAHRDAIRDKLATVPEVAESPMTKAWVVSFSGGSNTGKALGIFNGTMFKNATDRATSNIPAISESGIPINDNVSLGINWDGFTVSGGLPNAELKVTWKDGDIPKEKIIYSPVTDITNHAELSSLTDDMFEDIMSGINGTPTESESVAFMAGEFSFYDLTKKPIVMNAYAEQIMKSAKPGRDGVVLNTFSHTLTTGKNAGNRYDYQIAGKKEGGKFIYEWQKIVIENGQRRAVPLSRHEDSESAHAKAGLMLRQPEWFEQVELKRKPDDFIYKNPGYMVEPKN
jgi:hypothetical protein